MLDLEKCLWLNLANRTACCAYLLLEAIEGSTKSVNKTKILKEKIQRNSYFVKLGMFIKYESI